MKLFFFFCSFLVIGITLGIYSPARAQAPGYGFVLVDTLNSQAQKAFEEGGNNWSYSLGLSKKALQLADSLQYTKGMAFAYQNQNRILVRQKIYLPKDSMLLKFNREMALWNSLAMPKELAEAKSWLSKYYYNHLDQPIKAIELLQESVLEGLKADSSGNHLEKFISLSQMMVQEGKVEEAGDFIQKHLPYLPLLAQAQLNERLANIFQVYDDWEKARVFANQAALEYQLLMEKNADYKGNYQKMLNLRNDLSQNILDKNKSLGEYERKIGFFQDLILIIFALAALSTVLILWYSRRRIKHKNQALLNTNKKIQQQHLEISQQKDELSETSARLEELLEELQSQKEVLAKSNTQLESQKVVIQEKNDALVASEEELRQQSEELEAQRDKLAESNKILEDQAQILEEQKTEIQKQLKRRSKWNRMMKFAIQEKNQQQKKLKAQNRELETLQATKDLLISAVNHDLRNPLNALKNFSKKGYAGNSEELLHLIHRKSIRMEALIEDIINVYRADRLKLKKEMGAPYKAIEEAIREIKDMLDGENLPLIKNQADPQFLALFDYRSIERVLENFLTNAIKYTDDQGSIYFMTALISKQTAEGDEISHIRVSIKDSGIGIPPEKLANIFEPFVNPNARSLGSAQSVGIGLTFCKTIVEAHGSQLYIDSEFGKGTTFYFDLPQARPPKEKNLAHKELNINNLPHQLKELIQPFIAKLKVLEVEDNSEIEAVLEKIPEASDIMLSWKEALRESMDDLDQERYLELIQL